VDYITKPFQPEEVFSRVQTHLSLHRMRSQLEERNLQLQHAHDVLEQRVRERTRDLQALSDVNQALVRATSEQELLQTICGIFINAEIARLAWIGFALPDETQTMLPVAGMGDGWETLRNHSLDRDGDNKLLEHLRRAIESGQPLVVEDIRIAPADAALPDMAEEKVFTSCMILPLRFEQDACGTLSLCFDKMEAPSPEEMSLFREMAENLSFGIKTLRA
jgi:transcriptional regulator with GAF, ATPase, and Fis domain